MDKLRRVLSGGNDGHDQQSQAEEGSGITEIMGMGTTNRFGLSYSTRIQGFIGCFVLGFLFSLLGSMMLFFVKLRAFAIFYTLGSILGIGSTLFLMGPLKQLQRMFDPTRAIAAIVMILALILTLVSALHWEKTGLTMLFFIIQFLAMTWYSLSYIPYARDGIKKMLSGLC